MLKKILGLALVMGFVGGQSFAIDGAFKLVRNGKELTYKDIKDLPGLQDDDKDKPALFVLMSDGKGEITSTASKFSKLISEKAADLIKKAGNKVDELAQKAKIDAEDFANAMKNVKSTETFNYTNGNLVCVMPDGVTLSEPLHFPLIRRIITAKTPTVNLIKTNVWTKWHWGSSSDYFMHNEKAPLTKYSVVPQ